MKNEIALKTYDIDYSFLINNYLDQNLWDRQWTLLVYKDTKISLSLHGIRCQKPINIEFKVTVETHGKRDSNTTSYDLSNGNLTVLKKQINGCIKLGIEYCERWCIEGEDGYRELADAISEEEDRLREIAEEYLDDNNITLSDVRDAYIDRYVSDNAKGYTYRTNYMNGRKYMVFSDLWLLVAKLTNDDGLYNSVVGKLQNTINFDDLVEEIDSFISEMNADKDSEEYDTYMRNMQDNLVGV